MLRHALQVYRLDGVTHGEVVTCATAGGAYGNADLYVQPGSVPHPLSQKNTTCASMGSSSIETCKTKPVAQNTSVYVSVHAVESYSNLSLICTTCMARGFQYNAPSDCCGPKAACDGPSLLSRQCKEAVRFGAKCSRSRSVAGAMSVKVGDAPD
jgi:hypothetical protein